MVGAMKARFAILSAISFWLYAISTLVVNVMETAVYAKLVERGAGFSNAYYVIDIIACKKVLLIVGVVSICLFIVDSIFAFNEGHKNRDNQSMECQN